MYVISYFCTPNEKVGIKMSPAKYISWLINAKNHCQIVISSLKNVAESLNFSTQACLDFWFGSIHNSHAYDVRCFGFLDTLLHKPLYIVKSDAAWPTYLKIWRHMWMLPFAKTVAPMNNSVRRFLLTYRGLINFFTA